MPECTQFGSIRIYKTCALNLIRAQICFSSIKALLVYCCWNIKVLFTHPHVFDTSTKYFCCYCLQSMSWNHLLSLHSWIGALLLVAFTLQWVVGFLFLLLLQWVPGLHNFSHMVGRIKWVHVRLGPLFGILSAAAILTGLMQFASGYSVKIRLHQY